jgi:hypothetical protein
MLVEVFDTHGFIGGDIYHKGLIGGVLQRWLSFWKVLPSSQRNSGALSE